MIHASAAIRRPSISASTSLPRAVRRSMQSRVATAHVKTDSLAIVADEARERHRFSYWHIDPAVGDHSLVRTHQLIGHVQRHFTHVHFAEIVDGAYRDPLRPARLTPWILTPAPRLFGASSCCAAGARCHGTQFVAPSTWWSRHTTFPRYRAASMDELSGEPRLRTVAGSARGEDRARGG